MQNAEVSFTFTTLAMGATFDCMVDGGAWAPCTSPLTLTVTGEGSHTFAVRARRGNIADPTPQEASWTLDAIPPTTTVTAGPPAVTSSRSLLVDVTVTDGGTPGPVALECSLDGAAFAACSAPVTLDGLADGAHHLLLRAVDSAGNADPTPAGCAGRSTLRHPRLRSPTRRPPRPTCAGFGCRFSASDGPNGSGRARGMQFRRRGLAGLHLTRDLR